MTMESAAGVLKVITEESDVVGFTVAEYLPFDEHKLHKMFSEKKTVYGMRGVRMNFALWIAIGAANLCAAVAIYYGHKRKK